MTVDEKINLWQYTEIQPLSKKAFLVRNNFDGRLMVKHLAAVENFKIFETIKNIQSPYLMRVYDSVVENGVCISLGEYIEGVTLEKAVELRGVYSEKAVKNIMLALCDGLSALHASGIIHRDINPANVMIDKNGVVKIIDYDITRTVKENRNKDTLIMGTPGYASPEQFGFEQTDDKADIYSCGALMNYLLTGYLPNERLYMGGLTAIIKKCTELDPRNRFYSIEQLKLALLGKPSSSARIVNHRKLPGFKRGDTVCEVLATLFLVFYFIFLFFFMMNAFRSWLAENPIRTIVSGFTIFGLYTAIPYLSFGDIGGISRFIYRENPKVGKYILYAVGTISLISAFSLHIWLISYNT